MRIAAVLVTLLIGALPSTAASQAAAKHQLAWKEYVYPGEGFAIVLPQDPNVHNDATFPDVTAYTVHLSPEITLTLRAGRQAGHCTDILKELRDGALNGKQPGLLAGSVRDISVAGHPGVEWEYKAHPWLTQYERYLCGDEKFYVFAAGWAGTQKKPANVTRIVNSFRLLTTASNPK